MLGAIIGDIVGSVYKCHNIKTKDFPLFRDDCFFTDDTVMTVATADALMNGGEKDDFIDAYKKWGQFYPNAGYGCRFSAWINSDDREPYNSCGNGSAMRVSPCAWYVNLDPTRGSLAMSTGMSLDTFIRRSAEVTHNHAEGLKGARAVAWAIHFMREARADKTPLEDRWIEPRLVPEYFGYFAHEHEPEHIEEGYWKPGAKTDMKNWIQEYVGYDLTNTLDEIRPIYRFNESCQDTVPQAIIAFIESTDFEDAIRNAISLGGDSDTIAVITGSIAEAAYGIPQWIKDKAWTYLNEPLRDVCRRWRKFMHKI